MNFINSFTDTTGVIGAPISGCVAGCLAFAVELCVFADACESALPCGGESGGRLH